ncbi:peptidoglycan recognition family protein [Phycisphaeraceae bacterium D3-23]
MMALRLGGWVLVLVLSLGVLGCASARPGEPLVRSGDEIVVAGQLFHTGTPVVLWMDPGGYDAYRVEDRFNARGEHDWDAIKDDTDTPNRYGLRGERTMSDEDFERLRGGGWSLDELREKVDLFVIHYDVCGTSETCFDVLHDHRCLSVHFMLDIDGTIYQTLDVKERAWHASQANDRAIGIEIANIGAYPPNGNDTLAKWYAPDDSGRARITLPHARGDGGVRTDGFVGYPLRPEPVLGSIHGRALEMYDLTPEQYDALIKLTATLAEVFPNIPLTYPADGLGRPRYDVLTEDEYASYQGLIGHYHLTAGKIDPGPAFQWEYVTEEARQLLGRRRVESRLTGGEE